jgi:hypothetical protein
VRPILTVLAASMTTFVATNVDDIFLLTLFFVRRVSDAQMHRQKSNIEPLAPPMRLMLFLIAAFCRLAKSLSHSQQMGRLVGAVGIEPDHPSNSQSVGRTKPSRNPAALLRAKRLRISEIYSSPSAASTIQQVHVQQRNPSSGTWGTNPRPKRGRSVS